MAAPQAVQAQAPQRWDEAHHAVPESRVSGSPVSHEGNPQLVSFACIHHPLNKHSPILANYPQVIHFSSDDTSDTSQSLHHCHHWSLFLFHQGGLWLKRFHMRFASCPPRRCRLQPGPELRKSGRGKRQLGTRSVLGGPEHSRQRLVALFGSVKKNGDQR